MIAELLACAEALRRIGDPRIRVRADAATKIREGVAERLERIADEMAGAKKNPAGASAGRALPSSSVPSKNIRQRGPKVHAETRSAAVYAGRNRIGTIIERVGEIGCDATDADGAILGRFSDQREATLAIELAHAGVTRG
jgi:hypothetical protein